MNIYDRFEVKPIINVAGTKTRYGGALMEEDAIQAMGEAANYSVNLIELQASTCRLIAEKTHAEAGIVTCGAYASLTLAAAACICGFDVHRMNSLPDASRFPNEFIMAVHHLSGYDHSIAAAGGKIIPVGIGPDTPHPDEVREITLRDYEAEINNNSAGILYAARTGSRPPLADVVGLAHRYQIPVIVDAAAQVPPVENLYRFIETGADLVCFSGGKGIRGPQNSGILCGKKELICSAAMQMLDMAIGSFDQWQPPEEFNLLKEKLKGRPAHGIGRGAKVTKEAIIGLMVALEKLTPPEFQEKADYLRTLLNKIASRINGIDGIGTQLTEEYENAYPMLMIKVDPDKLGKTAADVVSELQTERIFARDNHTGRGILYIHSLNLDEKTTQTVGETLYNILRKENNKWEKLNKKSNL